METVSTKPYLIRAIYEWCTDQSLTPYVAAHVDAATRVPPGYAKDGQIVLNIAPHATDKLNISNEEITFVARFGGAVHNLYIPIANVAAIYARENGQGMGFELESPAAAPETSAPALSPVSETDAPLEPGTEPPSPPASGARPQLKIVK